MPPSARKQSKYYTEEPLHVRRTVAFDGAAGNGAIGTVTAFTITGRVFVHRITVFCTENLAGATATISLGAAADVDEFLPVVTATTLDANDWWIGAGSDPGVEAIPATVQDRVLSQDIDLDVLVAAITDGTLVIDVWYDPITADGDLRAP